MASSQSQSPHKGHRHKHSADNGPSNNSDHHDLRHKTNSSVSTGGESGSGLHLKIHPKTTGAFDLWDKTENHVLGEGLYERDPSPPPSEEGKGKGKEKVEGKGKKTKKHGSGWKPKFLGKEAKKSDKEKRILGKEPSKSDSLSSEGNGKGNGKKPEKKHGSGWKPKLWRKGAEKGGKGDEKRGEEEQVWWTSR